MKKKYLVLFYLATTLLGISAMFVVGCGGGGGPISSGSSSSTVSPSAAFNALLPTGQQGATYVGASQCTTCHTKEASNISSTEHTQHNVTCENCHGPGSAHVANPSNYQNNILSFPSITQYVAGQVTGSVTSYVVCNQCHGPQVSDWQSSTMSGLAESGFGGQTTVSSGDLTCFRCHASNFKAQYIDTPLENGQTPVQIDNTITSLGPNQLTAAASAVTSTAECVNCHDPHQQATGNTTANGQFYLRYATSNSDTTRISPATSAATYTTYNQVCGDCHNFRGGNPSDTALASGASRAPSMGPQMNMLLGISGSQTDQGGYENPPRQTGSHASAPDQCVTCHMGPSSTHTFLPNTDDSSCAPCHSATDAATKQSAMQAQIAGQLDVLQTNLSLWSKAALTKYAPSGDVTTYSWDFTGNIAGETSGTAYVPTSAQETAEVPVQIMRARFNYWYTIVDGSYGVHNPFYTPWLLTIANNNVVYLLNQLGVTPATVPSTNNTALLKAEFKAKANAVLGSSYCTLRPASLVRKKK